MKRALRYLAMVCLLVTISTNAKAQQDRRSLADKHAPAGIMGDHIHDKGEWMVEYKYMNMYMDGNRIGENRVSDLAAIGPAGGPPGIVVDGIRTNAGATPTQMTMEMHMMHIMYGASDNVTLYTMLMLPSLTMDHIRGDANPAGRGTSFTTHNSGFGDTTFGALLRLVSTENRDLILNLGGSIPTGDIYRESSAPTGGLVSQPLPFPMRLGSGTFNAKPGLVYKKYHNWGSRGFQALADIPIGRNYRGYSVSDEFRFNSWFSVLMTDNWSLSFRTEYIWRTSFDGNDSSTPDLLVSTNVEDFRGGQWTNFGIGSQLLINGHYLNVEYVPTIYQDLDGIQLETDSQIIASWSKSF